MDDKKLVKLAYELDDIFLANCNKYGINPLSLSAVILARLMKLNEEVGSDGDYRKLLSDISASGNLPDSITLQ